ncbi:MAG: hypothetical protein JW763_06230 [candidate division Zixibacteria bacterium]|nr:hypothetical protein [candidate division Zixibacteria bacterium]
MNKTVKRNFIWHPFLFAVFPVLFLYAQNVDDMLWDRTVFPIIVNLIVASGLILLLTRLLRDYFKAGLVTTLLYVFFFSFGHIVTALYKASMKYFDLDIGWSKLFLLPWLVLLICAVWYVIRTKRDLLTISKGLNFIGLVLVLIQFFQIGRAMVLREWNDLPPHDITYQVTCPDHPHDVYFIYLDGYARADVLRELYGYDNDAFLSFLRDRGFYIADSSHSNYCQTVLSATATFNMKYLSDLGDLDPSSDDRVPLTKRFWNNDVMTLFHDMGYARVAFTTGYESTELRDVEHFLAAAWGADEFQNILLSTTPLDLILGESYSGYDMHRKRVTNVLDHLTGDFGVASPKFVFAHIVSPHPPFVFAFDGEPRHPDRVFSLSDGSHYYDIGGDTLSYRYGYLGQLRHINMRLEGIIDTLLDRPPERQPIIIIQGDHGPGSELSWVGAAQTNLKERLSIFNATYYPDHQYQGLYPSITPVNTFRVLLNTYYGASLEILPDHSFYSTWAKPFAFVPISKESGGIYETLLDFYVSRSPERIEYRHMTTPKPAGTPCDAKGCIMMNDNGLCIDLEKPYQATRMEVSVDYNDNYAVYYRLDSTIIAMNTIYADKSASSGLKIDTLIVPSEAVQSGFNNIFILPQGGDDIYGIGHIRLGSPRQP